MAKAKRSWMPLIIIIVVVIMAGLGVWYWYNQKKKEATSTGSETSANPGTSSGQPTTTGATLITTDPTPTQPATPVDTVQGDFSKIALPSQASPGADVNVDLFYEISLPSAWMWSSMTTVKGDGQFQYHQNKELGDTITHEDKYTLKMTDSDMTLMISLWGNKDMNASPSANTWQLIKQITKTIEVVQGGGGTAGATPGSVVTPASPAISNEQPVSPAMTGAIVNLYFNDEWFGNKSLNCQFSASNPAGAFWATKRVWSGPGVSKVDTKQHIGGYVSQTCSEDVGAPAKGSTFKVQLFVNSNPWAGESDSGWSLVDSKQITYSG